MKDLLSNCFRKLCDHVFAVPLIVLGGVLVTQISFVTRVIALLMPGDWRYEMYHQVCALYALLIPVVFCWMSSKNFVRMPRRAFFPLTAAVFGILLFLSLYFISVRHNDDGKMFFENAAAMAKMTSFGAIKTMLANGNAWVARGFWCWYLPVKIFGESPWVYRAVNIVFSALTAAGVFALTRTLFRNERMARIACLLWVLAPFDYFMLHTANSDIIGVGCMCWTFFVLIAFLRHERRIWQENRRGGAWKTGLVRSALLALGFALLAVLSGKFRSLKVFILLPAAAYFAVYFLQFFLKNGFSKLNWRYCLRTAAMLGAALVLVETMFSLVFSVEKSKRVPKVDNASWLYSANARNFGTNTQKLFVKFRDDARMDRTEYMRQVWNEIWFHPVYGGDPRHGDYTRRLNWRFARISDIYSDYYVFVRPLEKTPESEAAHETYYHKLFHNIRHVFLFFLALAGVCGAFVLMYRMGFRNEFNILLMYSAMLIVYSVTIGEGLPRHGMLFLVPAVIAAAAGICSCTDLRQLFPAVRARYAFPAGLLMLGAACATALYAGKSWYEKHCFLVDLSRAELRIDPATDKNHGRMKDRPGCRDACAFKMPSASGSAELAGVRSGLVPGGLYRLSAWVYLTRDKKLNTSVTLAANGETALAWDSGREPDYIALTPFDADKAVKNFVFCSEEVRADEKGEVKLALTVKSDSGGGPKDTVVKLFNVELIPAGK